MFNKSFHESNDKQNFKISKCSVFRLTKNSKNFRLEGGGGIFFHTRPVHLTLGHFNEHAPYFL